MGVGALRLPWGSKDPYWDDFVNRPPSDANNLVPPPIRGAADGQVFPVKAETHSPEIMTEHIKELGRFLGADVVGIANRRTEDDSEYPYAIVCGIRSEYDPRTSPGIGGQAAALTGAFVTFSLAAAIREFGYRATRLDEPDVDRLAVHAGLGTLDSEGRFQSPDLGRAVYLADVVLTDLPLSPHRAVA